MHIQLLDFSYLCPAKKMFSISKLPGRKPFSCNLRSNPGKLPSIFPEVIESCSVLYRTITHNLRLSCACISETRRKYDSDAFSAPGKKTIRMSLSPPLIGSKICVKNPPTTSSFSQTKKIISSEHNQAASPNFLKFAALLVL